MTLTYDLFWSFRSPYSYLVTPRLLEFEREYDVTTNVMGGADAMITRADLAKGEYRDQFDGGDFQAVVANSPEAAEIVIQPVIDAGFEIRSAERCGNAKGSARWETTSP